MSGGDFWWWFLYFGGVSDKDRSLLSGRPLASVTLWGRVLLITKTSYLVFSRKGFWECPLQLFPDIPLKAKYLLLSLNCLLKKLIKSPPPKTKQKTKQQQQNREVREVNKSEERKTGV